MEPPPGQVLSRTVVDFVDFLRWGGREYVAGPGVLADEDLGPAVGVSRCSFRELNDRTGQMTPAPVDGDTGFLPAGTPFFAVSGWAPECRIAAAHGGRLTEYLAQDPNAAHATPSACAL
ncbi:hypothetical protein [Pseudonocardia pini]|uniref:hypothetical protein n=1 Tax=Pseudonocardia pini TaxID=2758030 RepID=UPI0015F0E505|nr:hypothetical protein [Pseudonocardia pini]